MVWSYNIYMQLYMVRLYLNTDTVRLMKNIHARMISIFHFRIHQTLMGFFCKISRDAYNPLYDLVNNSGVQLRLSDAFNDVNPTTKRRNRHQRLFPEINVLIACFLSMTSENLSPIRHLQLFPYNAPKRGQLHSPQGFPLLI